MSNPRQDLLSIYSAALTRVRGRDAVKNFLRPYDLAAKEIYLIAIGKAAASMALGASDQIKNQIREALIITKHGHLEKELHEISNCKVMESDHPVPGPASIKAGEALVSFVKHAPPTAHFLVLISGGASALVEVLPRGMSLERLREITDVMLSTGFNINQMNQVRRTFSGIKGGRLTNYLQGRQTLALMISDVPGDNPAVIGSGPLTRIVDDLSGLKLPEVIRKTIDTVDLIPAPSPELLQCVDSHIIATLNDAKNAAATKAKELGYEVTLHPEFIEGDAAQAAHNLTKQLLFGVKGAHIWGGETAITLPRSPGRGGRNQHLALVAAGDIKGLDNIWFLAAGTDGTDGPTNDAGALVDGKTIQRGENMGQNLNHALQTADSGSFLAASGDLITTGPSGTNVMDLMLGLKQ